MRGTSTVTLLLAGALAASPIFGQKADAFSKADTFSHEDALMRAMREEIKRSLDLKLPNLDAPYFIEYSVDDGRSVSATATP